jgi:crotonobetainyl-CoA:carnitine CoA-transferase CaiB-like acyl-CoA transferase
MAALGTPELADDPRFARRDARVRNADELHEMLRDWAATRTVAESVAALEAQGVPAAPVRDTGDAIRDPLVLGRGEVEALRHPIYGVADGLYGSGVPIVLSGSSTSLTRPAPWLGEHTESILTELLDYSDAQLAELRDAGAL